MNKVRSPRRKSKELLPDKATIHSYKSSTAGLLRLRKMPAGCGVSSLCSQNVLGDLLKYYSPMNTHGKTFVYNFCVL